MGMRIGSSNAMAMQSTALTQTQGKQKNVSDLFSALQSGDLQGAQKSYSALGLSSGATGSNSPLAQMGKALSSGNLSSAQEIAKSMNANAASVASKTTPSQTSAQPSTAMDLAQQLMSDFSSASSTLGLGNQINTLV
jgi:hypothetical protein